MPHDAPPPVADHPAPTSADTNAPDLAAERRAQRRRWLATTAWGAGATLGVASLLRVLYRQWEAAQPARTNASPQAEALPADIPALLRAQSYLTPSGQALTLERWLGRPLVLNFWASWCPPCLQEMPDLERFARSQPPEGWQVLGVALDQPEAVRKFLADHPVSFGIAVAGIEALPLVRALGNPGGGLPYTVLLDAAGQVQHRHTGATTLEDLRRWTSLA